MNNLDYLKDEIKKLLKLNVLNLLLLKILFKYSNLIKD